MSKQLRYKVRSLITVLAAILWAGVLMPIPASVHAQECFVAPEGLLGWWPGDGDATDIHGANNGVLLNGAAFGQGMVDQAFNLDGINDYVNVPATLLEGQQAFTIDAWIYTGTPNRTMVIAGEPGGAQMHTLSPGKVRLAWKQSSNIFGIDTPPGVVLADTWTHVAGTYNGATQEGSVFINGTRVVGPAPGINFGGGYTNQPLQIGGYGPPSQAGLQALFNGLIDEVELFDRVLGDAEVLAIHDAGMAGKCKDEDGDGVSNANDYCPSTAIPETVPTVRLVPNRWALIDDDSVFDTVIKGKGKGPNRSYIIEDTAGCSCEQIIEAQGLGLGHTYHGCSISAMDDWVELVTP